MSEAKPVLKMAPKFIFPKYILKIQKCRNLPDSLVSPPTHLCEGNRGYIWRNKEADIGEILFESDTIF